jgi:hypothetical protein
LVEFTGNIARKTGDPSLLMVEATKTQLAREIGEEKRYITSFTGRAYMMARRHFNIIDCEDMAEDSHRNFIGRT